ncbi:MAG TPA: 4-hydroxythreonine-4-phosphate dehydrogenase, partial [Marinobacter hydrocarbonoclasticus]|nr:4-hydroxythreonine-4-phosphate dehydrogenase [Marinobacter nauticus]
MSTPVILALTAGEPAGIGPELCLQLATGSRDAGLVVIASRELLRDRASQLGLQVELHDWQPGVAAATRAGHLSVRHVEGCGSTVAGRLDQGNSQYVLDT